MSETNSISRTLLSYEDIRTWLSGLGDITVGLSPGHQDFHCGCPAGQKILHFLQFNLTNNKSTPARLSIPPVCLSHYHHLPAYYVLALDYKPQPFLGSDIIFVIVIVSQCLISYAESNLCAEEKTIIVVLLSNCSLTSNYELIWTGNCFQQTVQSRTVKPNIELFNLLATMKISRNTQDHEVDRYIIQATPVIKRPILFPN